MREDNYEPLAGNPELDIFEPFDEEDERHNDIGQDDPWRGSHPFVSLIGKKL